MKKAVVLVVACIVAVVLLVLMGAFISGVVSEKVLADKETDITQAVDLAESGLYHGLEALRDKIGVDLDAEVSTYKTNSVFLPYVDGDLENKDSLDFLCDFLGFDYSEGKTNEIEFAFDISSLSGEDLLIDDLGSYSGKIRIKKQIDDAGNDEEGEATATNIFKFPYSFSIEATSTVSGVGKTAGLTHGEFIITIQRANFARFALFTNHHRSPQGQTVWFTGDTSFYGPVYTNERFSFANDPSGYFTDEVSQSLGTARFYNNGHSVLLDADSTATDVPTFESGFERGADSIEIETTVTQSDIQSQALGSMSAPSSNGIYVPNDGTTLTGGIYIKGNSTVTLSVDGSGNAVYTVKQGWTTKTITVNYTSDQTTVDSDTYSGLPDGVDDEGVIIYDDGSITSLSGTVQKDSQVTISSEGDIVITDDIIYEEYDTSPYLNAENYTNLLGIISWDGDVRIGSSASADLNVFGIIMAPNGVFTVDNYSWRSPSGDVTLLGGVITDYYGAFGTFSGDTQCSGYGRNFIYDQRMLGAMSPPYYPTSTYFTSSAAALEKDIGEMGLIWQDKN